VARSGDVADATPRLEPSPAGLTAGSTRRCCVRPRKYAFGILQGPRNRDQSQNTRSVREQDVLISGIFYAGISSSRSTRNYFVQDAKSLAADLCREIARELTRNRSD